MKRMRVRRPDARIAFVSGYWDGPLSGVALVRGERAWFCMKRDEYGPFSRRRREYWLIRMTPEQSARQLAQQEKFERMVGTHWTYVDGNRPSSGFSGRTEDCTKYYADKNESKEPPLSFEENEVIGWSTL